MRLSREQRRQLRAETAAARTAYDILAATTRHAAAAAIASRLIHPDAATATLSDWGLLSRLPTWAVDVTMRITRTGVHDGAEHAAAQAPTVITGYLRWALSSAETTAMTVVGVIPVDAADHDRFQVTVDTTLQIAVTVTGLDQAAHEATLRLHEAIAALAGAGLAVTDVHWEAISGPLPHPLLRAGAERPTVRPARPPLTVRPVACRDRAVDALHRLQHTIRHDLLRALTAGRIVGDFQDAADHVDQFLRCAGLDPLPRVLRYLVIAETTIRTLPAPGGVVADDLLPFLDIGGDQRMEPVGDWPVGSPQPVGDGRWQVVWHQEIRLWLRPGTPGDPAGRVREQLNLAMHHIDHDDPQIRVAGTAEIFDPFLDPTTD